MRLLALIPLVLIAAAGIGYFACRGLGFDPHVRSMVSAGSVVLLASIIAMLPALLMWRATASTVSSAALGGTVLHMFLTLCLAGMAWVLGLAGNATPFMYWLLAFYWISLLLVATAAVSIVKNAPPDAKPVNAATETTTTTKTTNER